MTVEVVEDDAGLALSARGIATENDGKPYALDLDWGGDARKLEGKVRLNGAGRFQVPIGEGAGWLSGKMAIGCEGKVRSARTRRPLRDVATPSSAAVSNVMNTPPLCLLTSLVAEGKEEVLGLGGKEGLGRRWLPVRQVLVRGVGTGVRGLRL